MKKALPVGSAFLRLTVKRAEKQGLRKPLAGPISPKVKMKRSVLDSCRIIVPKTYYRKRPEMLQNL